MSVSTNFALHEAFAAGTPRALQVSLLRDIYAVLPPKCDLQIAWTWTAMLDAEAVPGALRVLQAMDEEDRVRVISQARAIR